MQNTPFPAVSRRSLLKLCGFAALAPHSYGQSANNTVRLGFIGCGRRAHDLVKLFGKIKEVSIVALSDPDPAQMDSLAAALSGNTTRLEKIQDYRKLLEKSDIDAVVIASPNHWHTLHAIHAMQAGKDAYLEKPVTHDLWEGQQLLAAESKYGRIIAAGLQSRSDPGVQNGVAYLNEGKLGKILGVHICCLKERDSIGKSAQPITPPKGTDYNLWLGPAAELPLFRGEFHYDWHWAWNTGNGDIGNQAPHEIDIANRVLGDPGLPKSIRSFGGRFGWDDAGETPNLQAASYLLGGIPVIIEVNNLKLAPARNTVGARDGIRIGVVVRCEGGQLRGGMGGMYAVADDGKTTLEKFPGDGGAGHQENFINAVRSRRHDAIASPLSTAVNATAIAHAANVSYRSGSPTDEESILKSFEQLPALGSILADQSKQLADWGISTPQYTLGRGIELEATTAAALTPGIDPAYSRRACRAEFTIPEV